MERFRDKLSKVGAGVEPSKTLAVTALAKRLQAEGRDIISLTAGEPDFRTPDVVAAAGIAAIREGATRYTAAAGEPALRETVARVYAERWGVPLAPAQVCVSAGAKPLLYYLIAILADPGDEVLFPVPFWVSYEAMVKMRGAVPVPVGTRREDDLKLSAAGLDAALTPRSKVLLLNNPTNPTGAVYTRDELAAIAEVARARDLVILSDEIYEDLVFNGHRHQSLYNLADWLPERTIVVSGVSKSFAMTGWRLGYAIGDAAVIEALASYQSQALSSPSQISQRAALAGLGDGWGAVAAMREAFERRLNYCLGRMPALGLPYIEPSGAFYIFFDTSPACVKRGWADGQEFCARLLEETGVALIPGDAFGMPGWARLSFAASDEDLARAFDRLEGFLA
ncbi:MAG: pyridoxal phosphate-dependent aminotransferase [Candidatus Krumholzibacteriota bacterium]|nr:pyridoxal phosphate-dependent aminotransferase [Candidatus Krumholzibacteriota bacterium]